jgi:hypothetical protein
LTNNRAEVDVSKVVTPREGHNPQKVYFQTRAKPKRPKKQAFLMVDALQVLLDSIVREVFFILRQRRIGAADRRLGVPGTYGRDHPKGTFKIVARVPHTRSLDPPNQHDAHSNCEDSNVSR